jgi:hypothetical protein
MPPTSPLPGKYMNITGRLVDLERRETGPRWYSPESTLSDGYTAQEQYSSYT